MMSALVDVAGGFAPLAIVLAIALFSSRWFAPDGTLKLGGKK